MCSYSYDGQADKCNGHMDNIMQNNLTDNISYASWQANPLVDIFFALKWGYIDYFR